ncbi:MAG: hypothetical protein RLZZ337_1772, partial [Bacteroidota bacterium]
AEAVRLVQVEVYRQARAEAVRLVQVEVFRRARAEAVLPVLVEVQVQVATGDSQIYSLTLI